MYRRDFGVLVLSVFALWWSLQHEGAYEYRKAFYYNLPKQDDLSVYHKVPSPIVADLNGDGSKEVLMVTQDLELHLLSPQLASRFERGFAPAAVKGTKKVEVSSVLKGGKTPLAMKAGYIDPPEHDFVHVPRKMVVVIVTRGWVVVCLDHNMNVLWQTTVHDRFPRHSTTTELAIHISHHAVKQGDRGMVVIGGTVTFGAVGGGEEDAIDEGADVLDEELIFEDYSTAHSKSASTSTTTTTSGWYAAKGTPLHDLTDGKVDLSRHFQLYALEGASGEPRWRNAGVDFRKDLDRLEQETIPQHNYRLDAAALEAKRFGEVSCRDYREAIIRNLPHAWGRLSDTDMHEAHFAKHRTARNNAGRGGTGGAGGKTGDANKQSNEPPGKGGAGVGGPVNAIHLPPNALVAHTEQGLTAVNLYSGEPVCTLALAPHGLHTDINGDGVLEHVLAIGDSAHAHKGHHMHDFMSPCSAYVFSGYPPKTPLFNGTVCSPTSRSAMTSLLTSQRKAKGGKEGNFEGGHWGQGRLLMEAPPPVALPAAPVHDVSSGTTKQKHLRRSNPVFLTSFGDLTMYEATGGKRWQRRTPATWANAEGELAGDRVEPTLALLPMRTHAVPTAVLAAGTHTAVVYNSKGESMDSFELPGSPVAPLVMCDFSGSGLTDLLLVTKDTIYGFQLVKNMGAGMPYVTMLGALLIAVIVVFVTQQGSLGTQKTRSTDRID